MAKYTKKAQNKSVFDNNAEATEAEATEMIDAAANMIKAVRNKTVRKYTNNDAITDTEKIVEVTVTGQVAEQTST